MPRKQHLFPDGSHGADLHRTKAAELFGISPTAVTAEQRRFAKSINHAQIYRLGPVTFDSMLRAYSKVR